MSRVLPTRLAVSLLLLGSACTAAAEETARATPPPYVGVMGSFVDPAQSRDGSKGYGWQALYGLPLTGRLALEANLGTHWMDRDLDGQRDYYYHAGIDLTWNANSNPQGYGAFLVGGAGAAYEDVHQFQNVYPTANIGFGVLLPLWSPRLTLRSDARYVATFGTDADNKGHTYGEGRYSLGVQFALGTPALAAVKLGDSDGDSVTDSADLCPNTPPGAAVDAAGCPTEGIGTDADHDGVADAADQCPETPPGTIVDAIGCPAGPADTDGDGVLDALDACAATPPGFKVDARGCLVEQTLALHDINFESRADQLTPEAQAQLDRIAAALAAQPAVQLKVVGHTDALGPQAYNLDLSQRRARSVRRYLIAHGVAAGRLRDAGEGEFHPVADNGSEAGRAQNRRVEFVVELR